MGTFICVLDIAIPYRYVTFLSTAIIVPYLAVDFAATEHVIEFGMVSMTLLSSDQSRPTMCIRDLILPKATLPYTTCYMYRHKSFMTFICALPTLLA